MKPTIGRIVWWWADGLGMPFAAIIVRVFDAETGSVRLRIFEDDEDEDRTVDAMERRPGDTTGWEWPPRTNA